MKLTELIISEIAKISDIEVAVQKALDDAGLEQSISLLQSAISQANADILSLRNGLTTHINEDQVRWQSITDNLVAVKAQMTQIAYDVAKEVYAGTGDIEYDMTKPLTVIGNNGLIDIASGGTYTCTANGAIICACNAIVGVAKVITITHLDTSTTTWTSPLSVLGIPIGGDPNPSDLIPVSTGDVISVVGVLSLGETLNVTFYPNLLPQS